jgi:transcriptional regulator with XRE-family HTH domain
MTIGERLRQIREQKNLSQGDIERKTGLLRSYISRVENEHAVPEIGTLEKLARALEVPLYLLFCEEEKPREAAARPAREKWIPDRDASSKQARVWQRLQTLLGRLEEGDATLLLFIAQKMANKTKTDSSS